MRDLYLVRRRRRTRWSYTFQALVVLTLLALGWLFLVEVGSSHFVLVHLMYAPILLAAFWFRKSGAVLTGALAGLLARPLLPRDVTPAEYANATWLIRAFFFVATGVLSGHLSHLLDARFTQLRDVYGSITHLYARTLRGFMRLLEYKDEETAAHCERVARNALTLGHALSLDAHQLETLYWAGYLHDLGVENAFAVELFMAQQSVQDAVHSKSRQRTDQAMTEIRELAMQTTRTTTSRSAIRRPASLIQIGTTRRSIRR